MLFVIRKGREFFSDCKVHNGNITCSSMPIMDRGYLCLFLVPFAYKQEVLYKKIPQSQWHNTYGLTNQNTLKMKRQPKYLEQWNTVHSFIKCIQRPGPNTLHCTTSSPKVQSPFQIEVYLLQNQHLFSGSKFTCIRLYSVKKKLNTFSMIPKFSMLIQIK